MEGGRERVKRGRERVEGESGGGEGGVEGEGVGQVEDSQEREGVTLLM